MKTDQLDFGAMVTFYERVVDPLTLPIGLKAVELCNLAAGEKIIDVAAGTGALATEVARRGISALAIDIEPNMVARSAERLKPFSQCAAQIMSFEALDVPDSSMDAALSIFGVLAFPRGEMGLKELVRVTRKGGRVAVGAWDQERPAAPQYLAYDVFNKLFPGQQLWPADFFPVWQKAAVAAALQDAGCGLVKVHEVSGEWLVERPVDVMKDSGASIRMFPGYRALDDHERTEFDKAFVAAISRLSEASGMARIETHAFVVFGEKSD